MEVSGPDANYDGVVDGYEDIANDQPDMDGPIVPGGLVDEIADAIFPQTWRPPEN